MIAHLALATTLALNYTALMNQTGMPNAVGQTPAQLQAAAPASPPTVESQMLPVEQKIIERTNVERTRHGLRKLLPDLGLLHSARRHASWMTRNRRLQHTNAPVGENIAMGQHDSAHAVQSWMNSSGHRANMLNARYTRVGAAAYTATDGRIYWCIQFQP